MAQGFCPECDTEVGLGKTPKLRQRVTCHNCGAFLEIVETTPIELDWAYDDDDEFEGVDDDFFEDDDDDDD
jgi:lysine biosynthesis protein LysW